MFPEDFFNYREREERLNEERDTDFFSQIPDEMILKILRWLPQRALGSCASVNQRLSYLVKNESLWRNCDVLGKCLSPDSVKEILKRKPTFLRMARTTIKVPIRLPSDFVSTYLSYLDLSMAFIFPEVLAQILSSCFSLVKLSLESLEVSTGALRGLLQSHNSLDTLNFALCTVEDSDSLANLIRSCRGLKSLNFGSVEQGWTQEDFLRVITSIPSSVEHLNLSGFRNLMTDTHVLYLVDSVPGVTDLDLSDAPLLSEASVLALVKKLKVVQHIGLSRCYSIPVTAYLTLSYIPTLRHLEIFSLFREDTLRQLVTDLPGIAINECPFSSVARPTIAHQRNTIWGHRIKSFF